MLDRRTFLASAVALNPRAITDVLAAIAGHPGTPQETATDESFWFRIQQAFAVDRSMVNLNSGGVSPSPGTVHDAYKRHLDFTNQAPTRNLWGILEPQRENVREHLARVFGADTEEVAITRNASESLQILQLGHDLKAGDEVLCNDQDYPRMITTFKQRAKRDGIVLKMFPLPVPTDDPAEVVARYAKNITDKTKLILVSHVVFLTGTILPVKEICALGRAKGIPVLVDGAHAFAHVPFTRKDIECDFYATSLHKWLFCPIGTGLLYVRKDKIGGVWPLMAAGDEQKDNIRKFEEIGTHPAGPALAIGEALTFHTGIGAERKFHRMRYLRDRWANRLMQNPRVKMLTSLKHSGGISTFAVDGIDPGRLGNHLWEKHRIFVTTIGHEDVKGTRISPSVWSTVDEIDRFCEGVEGAIKAGVK